VRGSVMARRVRPGLPGPVLNVAGHTDRVAATGAAPGARGRVDRGKIAIWRSNRLAA